MNDNSYSFLTNSAHSSVEYAWRTCPKLVFFLTNKFKFALHSCSSRKNRHSHEHKLSNGSSLPSTRSATCHMFVQPVCLSMRKKNLLITAIRKPTVVRTDERIFLYWLGCMPYAYVRTTTCTLESRQLIHSEKKVVFVVFQRLYKIVRYVILMWTPCT